MKYSMCKNAVLVEALGLATHDDAVRIAATAADAKCYAEGPTLAAWVAGRAQMDTRDMYTLVSAAAEHRGIYEAEVVGELLASASGELASVVRLMAILARRSRGVD